jgi:hypothetical protein
MLVKKVLNPEKKKNIRGNTFHLLFLGIDAVLYDELWDEPIIYGNKGLVRVAITDPRKLSTLLPIGIKDITVYVYKIQENGSLKLMGSPLKGKPTELTVPSF